jgi:hypothetical protein
MISADSQHHMGHFMGGAEALAPRIMRTIHADVELAIGAVERPSILFFFEFLDPDDAIDFGRVSLDRDRDSRRRTRLGAIK